MTEALPATTATVFPKLIVADVPSAPIMTETTADNMQMTSVIADGADLLANVLNTVEDFDGATAVTFVPDDLEGNAQVIVWRFDGEHLGMTDAEGYARAQEFAATVLLMAPVVSPGLNPVVIAVQGKVG